MKNKMLSKTYYLLVFMLLYCPLIKWVKYVNLKKILSNRDLLSSAITTLLLSVFIACIVGILSLYISRYYYLKKKSIQKPLVIPLMVGLLIYICRITIGINSYLLYIIGYICLLTPFVSYLEYKYIKSIVKNNKDVLKDFGRVEFLSIMDKSIVTYFFLSMLIVYGDNIISGLFFDNKLNVLSTFIKRSINNNELIANSLFLSFGVILLLLLIIYMIFYEIRLRGKYEKNN